MRRQRENSVAGSRRPPAAFPTTFLSHPSFALTSLLCSPPDGLLLKNSRQQKCSFTLASTKCSSRTSGTWQPSPGLMKGCFTCRETQAVVFVQGVAALLEPTVRRRLLIHATCDVIKANGQAPPLFLSSFACCFSALR